MLNSVECIGKYAESGWSGLLLVQRKTEIDFLWIASQSLRYNSTKLQENDKCIDELKMINLI